MPRPQVNSSGCKGKKEKKKKKRGTSMYKVAFLTVLQQTTQRERGRERERERERDREREREKNPQPVSPVICGQHEL